MGILRKIMEWFQSEPSEPAKEKQAPTFVSYRRLAEKRTVFSLFGVRYPDYTQDEVKAMYPELYKISDHPSENHDPGGLPKYHP